MSKCEEEKKAVESLKIKAEFIGDNYSFGTQGIINLRNELKIVLNLIEKQQKKNEELTFLVNCYTNEYFIEGSKVEKDYIRKDKIKEKIEEVQARMGNDCITLHDFQREAKIDVLKELLEEK